MLWRHYERQQGASTVNWYKNVSVAGWILLYYFVWAVFCDIYASYMASRAGWKSRRQGANRVTNHPAGMKDMPLRLVHHGGALMLDLLLQQANTQIRRLTGGQMSRVRAVCTPMDRANSICVGRNKGGFGAV